MILSTEDEFSTIEFITDEVLIVIPMTPMHDDKAGLVNVLCERRIPLFEGVFLLF
jgi:uncharacterized metal-binding protein YceD (DUF177 family)